MMKLIHRLIVAAVLAGGLVAVPTIADAKPAPKAIACPGPGSKLTVSKNLRKGACRYVGPARVDMPRLRNTYGPRVKVTKMRCGKGRWLAVDRTETGMVWAYCEAGKPTKAAKRYAKRYPYKPQRRYEVVPRISPDPVTRAPIPPTCAELAARFPVHKRIGLSYVYPFTAPTCDDMGRLVITNDELPEDAYGWNCYGDGNADCGSHMTKLDPGCLTDQRDGYTMCADGRVYLRTTKNGTVSRAWLVWRLPR